MKETRYLKRDVCPALDFELLLLKMFKSYRVNIMSQ